MNKFERFIIYPMLFIALFFSFSGEEVKQTTAQKVHDELIAKSIKIVNEDGVEMITLDVDKSKTKEDSDSGVIFISSNSSNSDNEFKTGISNSRINVGFYDKKEDNKIISGTSIGTGNIGFHSETVNHEFLMKIGEIDRTNENDKLDSNSEFGLDIYAKNIDNNEDLSVDEHTIFRLSPKIFGGSEIELSNLSKKSNIKLKSSSNGSYIQLNNKKGNNSVYMGQNDNGHGLINIYDKYGEDRKSYSFR
ncbi:MAG: hypothetical protein ACOCV1_07495 [Bacillota bacterium]